MGANIEAVDEVRDMERRPGERRPLDDEDDDGEADGCAANSVDSDSDVEGLSSYTHKPNTH